MSIFRKPKKNIQRRVFSSCEDEGANDDASTHAGDNSNTKPFNLNIDTKIKKDDRQKQKNTLLSFDVEEADGEIFQVKKSSHSKKIMRLLDKERKRKKEKTNTFNEAELENTTENELEKPSEKSENSNAPLILNGRAALVAGRDDISSDEDSSVQPRHRFSHPDNVKIVVESGIIPDAAMIHAARKRRQRARELGTDYIPLEHSEKKDKGRLIREEDADCSDEERIDMSVNTEEQDKINRREQFFAAQDRDSDLESDKETEEWENQQIKKGVTGVQINITQQDSSFSSNLFNSNTETMKILTISEFSKNEDVGPKTPATIAQKLRERLENLKTVHEEHRKHLSHTIDDLEVVRIELLDLEKKAPDCAKRFRFYQELRGYITDLVECLDEKVQLVTSAENRWIELIGKRSIALSERRRQDVRDQAEEITLQTRVGIRRNGGPEEEVRIRRAAEREGRRNRRRRAREQTALQQSQTQSKHLEGMSSDDEVPEQENILFRQQKEQILLDVDKIFSDVVEEFTSVDAILERFDSWRNVDFNAYCEAYASLVLPKILSPILKLQLLTWDPLCSDTTDLEQHSCTRKLMLYGLKNDESEDVLRNDPDVLLFPSVIDRTIIPKLTQIVEKVWDPMSSSQSLRLVGLVGRYVRKYPTLGVNSKSLTQLLTTVIDKLQQAVEHDVFIPIFPKQVLETKAPFFQRQFNSAVKLLGNITCWQGTLADHVLKDLALNSLLNRYLLSGLRVCQLTDAVAKAQLILNALPRVWLNAEAQTDLQMFITCIMQLAGDLNRDNPLHLESLEIITSIRNTLHI